MGKRIAVTVAILMIFSMAGAQGLTLDKILARHFKAMGHEKLGKIHTIVMTGTIVQQDAMPVKIIRMRPDKYLMESDIQDITVYQGYDGQTAWWTTPWTGNPKPQPMPDDRARELRGRADFDGLLYNWKTKGHAAELISVDTVEKTMAYQVKITKKDGGVEFLFIDTASFVIQKRMYDRMVRGKEVTMEIYFRDYRMVQGCMFPFTQETYVGGQPYNSIQFDSIELNKPVDGQVFRMQSQNAK